MAEGSHEPGFEVSTAVKIQVEVFWVMTLCGVVVGYQLYGGLFCLHFQGEMNGTGRNGVCI
jgi:hypothetical protein